MQQVGALGNDSHAAAALQCAGKVVPALCFRTGYHIGTQTTCVQPKCQGPCTCCLCCVQSVVTYQATGPTTNGKTPLQNCEVRHMCELRGTYVVFWVCGRGPCADVVGHL